MRTIKFKKVSESEYEQFRDEIKRIFAIAVAEEFGEPKGGENVISDDDINASLYNPSTETFHIFAGGERIGGIVLNIDSETQHNSVELLYILPECHSKGIGSDVWKAVEAKYPQTKVWELVTPYFEKRNINFYVNKCGFHIVEFYNVHHKSDKQGENSMDFHEDFFRFEKKME